MSETRSFTLRTSALEYTNWLTERYRGIKKDTASAQLRQAGEWLVVYLAKPAVEVMPSDVVAHLGMNPQKHVPCFEVMRVKVTPEERGITVEAQCQDVVNFGRVFTDFIEESLRVRGQEPTKANRGRGGAFTPEGERALVLEYWRDKATGLRTEGDYEYDNPEDRRRTQEDWAGAHGISLSSLKRYLKKHADLNPRDEPFRAKMSLI